MRAVLLAGGKGRRLRPYTTSFPKPLMPVGDKPILEVVVRQLKSHGFDNLTMAVGHLAWLLEAYFGDGGKMGVHVGYSHETTPLGTAGPLGLIDPPNESFLVMNGDLLTDLDFGAMMAAHRESGAAATVAVYQRDVKIDLGVLEIEDGRVTGYVEKPTLHYPVSTGIYCFHPRVLERIAPNQRLDLPDLILELIGDGEVVDTFPLSGYWLDIGRPDDYELAQEKMASGDFDFA